MQRQQLQSYTKNVDHHGLGASEILNNFMEYQKICRDPLNIFRFMQEKAICIFMPEYWIGKATFYEKIGDYRNCFDFLKRASELVEGQNQINMASQIDFQSEQLRKSMINEMKGFVSSSKRSVAQSSKNLMDNSVTKKENSQKMLKLYEQNYKDLRKKKEEQFDRSLTKFPNSWLFDLYEKEELEQVQRTRQIDQSGKISRDRMNRSMFTPVRNRDPLRLTKTMDSVQIAKKRRMSTRCRNAERSKEDQDETNSIKIESLPVGARYAKLKKKGVSFPREIETHEKLREHSTTEKTEFKSAIRSSILKRKRKAEQKMDIEDS